jgi:hypothetical protein
MNIKYVVGISAVVAALSGFGIARLTSATPLTINTTSIVPDASVVAELTKYKEREVADQKLGQYVINMMYMSPRTVKELSPARMQVIARSVVRVSNDIFDNDQNKRDFIMALQIESGFLKYAQSPTGPKGLAQLARKTFHEALADCGVDLVKDDDVWETDLNLYAGACYFKKQLLQFKDSHFAVVAYNQGPESDSAKVYAKTGWMEEKEPLQYLAKYSFLERKVDDKKKDGVPAIADLPKPSSKKMTK